MAKCIVCKQEIPTAELVIGSSIRPWRTKNWPFHKVCRDKFETVNTPTVSAPTPKVVPTRKLADSKG